MEGREKERRKKRYGIKRTKGFKEKQRRNEKDEIKKEIKKIGRKNERH